jgi:hypothetical protein
MVKKALIATLLVLIGAPAVAADYFLVVPVKGRTQSDIQVVLGQSNLPQGQVGQAYGYDFNQNLQVIGDAHYTGNGVVWSVGQGSLPPGLVLTSVGMLSGAPATAGGATFGIRATYKTKTVEQSYQVEVTSSQPALMQFSGYRAWSDNTLAQSCKDYRYPTDMHRYDGATGDGIYRIQLKAGAVIDTYCDMTNDGGGWTLVMNAVTGQSANWYGATSALNIEALARQSATAKLADSDIQTLTTTALRLRSNDYGIARYVKPQCRYAHQSIPSVGNGCGTTYASIDWTGPKNFNYTGTVATGISDVDVSDDTEYFQTNDTRSFGWFAGDGKPHNYKSGSGFGGGAGFMMWAK